MDQSLGYNKQYFITALYDVTVHGKVYNNVDLQKGQIWKTEE